MDIINRSIQFLAEKRGMSVGIAADYVPDWRGVSGGSTSVNHKNALTFTAAFSAISTKAENMASLPKQVYKSTSTGKITDKKHPVYSLIHFQPNPQMNDFSFWEKIEADVAGWGNSIVVIESDNQGRPKHLWCVDPDNYLVIKHNRELYYKIPTGDFSGTYHSSEILHFKYFSVDGINGIDPISYNARALSIGMGGQTFAGEYFDNKGKMRGVFETDNALGDKEWKSFKKRMAKQKDHSTPLLEYGIKYKDISLSPDAAQAIQSRIFSIQDASRIWKVPPSLLAENSNSTFANTEQQDIQFVKYGLRPECKRFETEIETKLFSGDEREVYSVKFDLGGLLRGDIKTRAIYYKQATGGRPWLLPNEARELENMEPIAGDAGKWIDPANIIGNQKASENNKIKE